MSTSFPFNGQIVKIPGAYSNIKSGIKNPSVNLPFGNVLIIDTNSGAGYGGGAGIDGELSKDKESIYEFDNIDDFRNFVKGGYWWLLAQPLFRPAKLAARGVSKIIYIKAATTVAAKLQYEFFGDGGSSLSQSIGNTANGGSLTIKVTDEGIVGNGQLNINDELSRGFAAKMAAGIIDSSKFTLNFYRGTYKELDTNNLPYDGITENNSLPLLLMKSPEFDNIQTLIDWMLTDAEFLKDFKLTSHTVDGNGTVDSDDLAHNSSYNLATGGTETYVSSNLLDKVLENSTDLVINFVISDKFGSNAQTPINDKLTVFCTETCLFKPELYIGGGDDNNTFALSKAIAKYFDNDSVTIVHSGPYKQTKQGLRAYDVLYHLCAVVGREAGLEPQVPVTFKNLDFDGMRHKMNDKDIIQALDAGVLTTRLEAGSFDIVKGINSLQDNTNILNDDGTTHSKQLKRIERQLNNSIRINAKKDLLKDPNGVNRNTLSITDVETWLEKELKTHKALPDNDNLIISFQDIVITRTRDAYYLNYKFEPNSEISFLFSTGLVIGI